MTTKLDVSRMRMVSYLLPDPGGEVVRACLDEIERLNTALIKAENNLMKAKKAPIECGKN